VGFSDARLRLANLGLDRSQVGPVPHRLLDERIHAIGQGCDGLEPGKRIHLIGQIGRQSHGDCERAARRGEAAFGGEDRQLGLRESGLRLQDVGDGCDTDLVALFCGVEVGLSLLEAHLLRREERSGALILEEGGLRDEDDVLNRGVVGPIGGDQRFAGLSGSAGAATKVEQKP
jgi:hypothetical protein